jgi:hypothetical protein
LFESAKRLGASHVVDVVESAKWELRVRQLANVSVACCQYCGVAE